MGVDEFRAFSALVAAAKSRPKTVADELPSMLGEIWRERLKLRR
jgi:hypothetical protein